MVWGMAVRAWVWAVLVVASGSWVASECLDVSVGTLLIPGDAVLTLLVPLHHGPICSQLGLAEVQVAEAAQLAVQKVNQQGLVPGASLGLRIVDTCGLRSRSVKMATNAWVEDSLACPHPALTLGILGPSDAASASAVGSLVKTLDIPVMAYGPRPVATPHALNLVMPAPHHAAQAAVQVLTGAGVSAVSVVCTDDTEGETLAQHFVEAANYWYVCVAVVVSGEDIKTAAEAVRDGPGTVVVMGSRHKIQHLAQALGQNGCPADMIVLLEAGPLPQAELAGLTVPALLLQRMAPVLPDFPTFMKRNLKPEDEPRRQYLTTLAECDSCSTEYFGYDASAPATIAAVLHYVAALREAHTTLCNGNSSLCQELRDLDAEGWEDLLTSAVPETTMFPELAETALIVGGEDTPRYTVKFLQDGNLTQIGQADESSAVLGQLEVPEPRCGSTCPCQEVIEPLPLPPAANITRSDPGFNIFGGSKWWSWEIPKLETATRGDLTMYITAFTFVVVLLFMSGLVCIYNLIKPPTRN